MLGSLSATDVVSGSRVTLIQMRSVLCAVLPGDAVGLESNRMVSNVADVCCNECTKQP